MVVIDPRLGLPFFGLGFSLSDPSNRDHAACRLKIEPPSGLACPKTQVV